MNFSMEEIKKIEELKNRVSGVLVHGYQRKDYFLIRWLRARKLNVDKAEEMLRKSLKWRIENNIDGIYEREGLPENRKRVIPFAYCGVQPGTGNPVFLYLMGRDDIRSMIEKIGSEECIRASITFMEMVSQILRDLSEKTGKPVTQFIEIMDLEGYSYRQITSKPCRDCIVQTQIILDANYPEILKHMTCVNAPKVFALIFNMMKPFIPKETLAKIDIYGTEKGKWTKVLASKLPMDLIPKHWGGTLEGSDEYCSQSDIWMFGHLDSKYFGNADEDGFINDKVNAGEKLRIDIDFEGMEEERTTLTWKFKSEDHDIRFGILFGNEEVLPVKRVDSQTILQEGFIECKKPGKYTIMFDNTYSYRRAKIIHHKIDLVSGNVD